MSLLKEKGFVIASRLVNDSDIIITVLSEKSDKKKFIIKGLKKSKKRPVAASEPGSLIELDYYAKENTELFHVKEIGILDRFEFVKSSYGGFLLVTYIAELIDRLLQDREECRQYYQLYHAFIKVLEEGRYNQVIIPYIKLKLLSVSGMVPQKMVCSICGQEVAGMESAVINPFDLTIVCCGHSAKNDLPLVRILEKMLNQRFSELILYNFKTEDVIVADRFINSFLGRYLGKELKSSMVLYQYLGNTYELSY